jgi:hypothetical protein
MRREYAGAAKKARLATPLGGTSLDLGIVGDDLTGWPDGTGGPFFVVIGRGTSSEEKILCSSRTSNSLTVYTDGIINGRGADGTSITEHDYNDFLEHIWTATDADEANEHVNSTSNVHGVTSNVVGVDDAQTLTGKSISGNANTLTNIAQASVTGLVPKLAALDAEDIDLQAQIDALDASKADTASPTFTGTVVLPATTSIGPVSSTEIGYVDGATSNIQAQINAKAPINSPTFTGTPTLPATTIWDGLTLTDITNVSSGGTPIPVGGSTGEALIKSSDADYAVEWGAVDTAGTDGLVLLTQSSFISTSSAPFDPAFISEFRNYRIILEVTGSSETSIRFKMRTGGVDTTGSDYHYQQTTSSGTSVTASRVTGETSGLLGKVGTTRSLITIDMLDPASARTTIVMSKSAVGSGTGIHMYDSVSSLDDIVQYQGITVFPSVGLITGRIKVYGLTEGVSANLTPPTPPPPLVLYDRGDEITAVTGGWIAGYTLGSGSSAKNAADMSMTMPASNSTYRSWVTTNQIDVTAYSNINVTVSASTSDFPEQLGMGFTDTTTGFYTQYDIFYPAEDGLEHDLYETTSPLSGLYYIVVMSGGANYGRTSGTVNFHKIWLS